jgi:hypothetical protein
VRVRIGIHTGEPVVTEEGYVGLDVHRAARIMAAAHGDQVLLSETTARLLDSAPELRNLGEHRLKDLTAPQHLYQLGDRTFPPPRTLYQTNLPIQPTPLVGRARIRRGWSATSHASAAYADGCWGKRKDAARASARGRGSRAVPRRCLLGSAPGAPRPRPSRARDSSLRRSG